jgi:hypothetical protein
MRHDETRDNTTAIETQSIDADAHADTRETPTKLVNDSDAHELGIYRPGTWRGRMLRQAKAMFGPIRSSEPDPAGVQLETRPVKVAEERHEEINDGANGYDDVKIAREHDEIVAKARQESEERNGYDDEPEDDGQPSEYDEWQDYMGGDDWDQGQYDDGGY